MHTSPLNICIACLYLLISSSALPRSKEYSKIASSDFTQSDVGKAQPSWIGIGSKDEPSCEELKLMWRFSKRQSRTAEITNEIPTYRDPFAYNVWEEYPRPRSAGRSTRYRRPIFGKLIHNVPRPLAGAVVHSPDNSPERVRAFEEVASLFGTSVYPVSRAPQRKTSFRLGGGASAFSHPHIRLQEPLTGSFQHLKDLIIAERSRELQEQRMTEEAAARAEALGNIHFGRIVQDQKIPSGPYAKSNGGDLGVGIPSVSRTRNRGIVAFPDLLAPASSQYSEEEVLPASQMASYKPRSYEEESMEDLEENPWVTW